LRSWLLLVLAFLTPSLWAQYASGPQVLTFFSGVDDSDQPYALYLPKDYNPHDRYPLVVMLHGAWSNHRLALRRVFGKGNGPGETDVEATRYFPNLPDVDFIVAAPLARGTMGYQGITERDVLDVVNDVEARFPIDPDRLYLTGLSMGGGGTLWLGLTRPDMWAAIAPVCPAPPKETASLIPNALNLPVHLFQGDADPLVPVQQTRDWVAKLKQAGTKTVDYDEYPGVLHNSWDKAYEDAQIFKWFDQYKRDLWPQRVRFASFAYEHQKAYWVVLDQITPGTVSQIDARFTGTNSIEVTTSSLTAFSLLLYKHPSFVPGRELRITIDGATIQVPPITSTVSFAKPASGWKLGDGGPGENEKQQGSEGPARMAISGRHIYVYGTKDNPPKEELDRRRRLAAEDSTWAPPGARLELWPHSIADKDVRPSDWKTSNMVLLGNEQTNAVISQVSSGLPMTLAPTASGWNLTFIWPYERHYLLVSSGDDIKTQAGSQLPGWMPLTKFPAAIFTLDDYVLYHNGEKVVAGRFDASWKIPAADADKLKASGVVTLRQGATQ
jgi:pimeloyl-ACP methyl ester carboxylesterase